MASDTPTVPDAMAESFDKEIDPLNFRLCNLKGKCHSSYPGSSLQPAGKQQHQQRLGEPNCSTPAFDP